MSKAVVGALLFTAVVTRVVRGAEAGAVVAATIGLVTALLASHDTTINS